MRTACHRQIRHSLRMHALHQHHWCAHAEDQHAQKKCSMHRERNNQCAKGSTRTLVLTFHRCPPREPVHRFSHEIESPPATEKTIRHYSSHSAQIAGSALPETSPRRTAGTLLLTI